MLRADIAAERAVTMDYNAQIGQVQDEGPRPCWPASATTRSTTTSCFRRFSEDLTGAASSRGPAAPAAPAPPKRSTETRLAAKPTVGSLIGQ